MISVGICQPRRGENIMSMTAKELRKLQLIELDLLLELDRICRKNNIQYFLSAGTVLGAVRHKGFIPWDDDLDTRMHRDQFELFVQACEKDLDTDKFFLQTAESDKEYRWGYAKLRRKGTEYLRNGQEAIKCMSGVSIDIFVIDNLNDNDKIALFHHYLRRACIKTLWSVVGVTQDKSRIKRLLYRGLRHVPKNVPLNIINAIGKYNNKKKTEYVECLSFYRRDSFLKNYKDKIRCEKQIKAEWFEEAVELEFEGFPFFVCKDYMTYLESKYKNMWEFPPEDQRLIHPPKSFNFDVEISLRGRNVEEYMNREYQYLTKEDWDKSLKK